MDGHRTALTRGALVAFPLAFLALFFGFPLWSIIQTGLRGPGALETFADAGTWRVVWFTLWQAAVSTALTLAVGLPIAYALARFVFRGRALLEAAVLIPFVLPTVVVGMAFGGGGASLTAMFAAHVFLNVAVVVRIVGGAWAAMDPEIEDAAESLGARGWRRFTAVLLPLARPAIAGATTLVFLFTCTSFGVVLLLAPAGRATVEIEIFRRTTQLLDLPTAAVLAILQVVFVSALLVLDAVVASRGAVRQRWVPSSGSLRLPRSRGERAYLVVCVAALILLLAGPPLHLVWRSFVGPNGFTIARYTQMGSVRQGSLFAVSPLDAVGNSLRFAAAAAALALGLGLPLAVGVADLRGRSGLWGLIALPLGVSAVTLGFGYVVAFDADPLDLRGSPWLVPLAQAVVAIPFVVRIVAPVLATIDADLTEIAEGLGASPWSVFTRVTLPVASPVVLVAAVFAFAVSMGEFGATSFLARADTPTMPIAIARLLSQPGSASVGQAAAMSVLLMLVTAGVALAIGRVRVGTFGRF